MLCTVIAFILAANPQGNHQQQAQQSPQRQNSREQSQVAARDRGGYEKPNLYDYNEYEIRGELRREAYYQNNQAQEGSGDSCDSCNSCNKPTIWPRQLRDPGDD